ncbi:family 78 glycoside hydrolase catalytic domain, partial [bacterium]|nr:family 78 glycoside hydrolase catalytic domain [bacterium]
RIVQIETGHYFIDFGKAAFGTIEMTVPEGMAGQALTIHLGEKHNDSNRVDRTPPGTVRYRQLKLMPEIGRTSYRLEIPPDARNTGRRTIKMPPETSEVLPFRYCEIEGWTGPLSAKNICQIVVHYPFDANTSSFTSSNETLNAIWDLCKHTIKATSFCGIYVDGDRERFPREADAYINQIGHYAVDSEYTLARRTHELMLTHTSQWTEWILQSISMAWADYVYTGDPQMLTKWYPILQAKSLTALAETGGLISTRTGLVNDVLRKAIFYFEGEHVWGPDLKDIVDWPYCERDEFDFQDYNTVVNAFYYQGLRLLARIATVLDKKAEATHYTSQAERVFQAVNTTFVNPESGIYVDGKGSTHSSLHANIFPLAFGLVLPQNKAAVIHHIKTKGMACSVYGAQYLLEGLYQNSESNYALELMTQKSKRSWYNMLQV